MALDFRKWHAAEMKHRPRRASTRWTLAAGMLFVAAIPVFELLAPGDRSALFPNVFPFAFPLIIGASMSPYSREAFLTDRGFATFDEFERAALLAALRRSYLTIMLVLAGIFVWLATAAHVGWPMPTVPRQWSALGFALIMAMFAMPAMFAEFMVPMPDPEDEPM